MIILVPVIVGLPRGYYDLLELLLHCSSNRSPYRIQCNSSSNRSPYICDGEIYDAFSLCHGRETRG